jgi:hypothetical protein
MHAVLGRLSAGNGTARLDGYRAEARAGRERLAEATTDETGRFLLGWSSAAAPAAAVDVVVFRRGGGRLGHAHLPASDLGELSELEFPVPQDVAEVASIDGPAPRRPRPPLADQAALGNLYGVVLDSMRAGLLDSEHGLFAETMWVHRAIADLEQLHDLGPAVLHGDVASLDDTRRLVGNAAVWPARLGRGLPDLGPHSLPACLLKLIDPHELVGAGLLLDALDPQQEAGYWLDRALGFYLQHSAPVRAVLHAAQGVRAGELELDGFAELYRAAMSTLGGGHHADDLKTSTAATSAGTSGGHHEADAPMRGLPFGPSRWDPCTIAWGRCTGLVGEAGPRVVNSADVPVVVGRIDPDAVCRGWQGALSLYPRTGGTFPVPEPAYGTDEGLALDVRGQVVPLTVVPNGWTASRITVQLPLSTASLFGCARVFWRSPVQGLAARLASASDCYNLLGITPEIVHIEPELGLLEPHLAFVGAEILAFTADGQRSIVADACTDVRLRWSVDSGVCRTTTGQPGPGSARVSLTAGGGVVVADAPLVGELVVNTPSTTSYTLTAESFAGGRSCATATSSVTVNRVARITLSAPDRVFGPSSTIPVDVRLPCPAPVGGLTVQLAAVHRQQPQLPVLAPVTVTVPEGRTLTTAVLGPPLQVAALADVTGTAPGHLAGTVTLRINPTACLPASFGPNQARYGGRWGIGPAIPGVVGIHLAVLPTGEVLLFGYDEGSNPSDFLATSLAIADSSRGRAALWNPDTGAVTNIPLGRNLFCSHHCLLGDGQLFVAGGQFPVPLLAGGANRDLHLFDPAARSWTRIQPDMPVGRWYPTCATMPDGKVLVISGNNADFAGPGGIQNSLQIFDPLAPANPPRSGRAPLETTFPLYHLFPFAHVLPSSELFVHWKRTTALYNPGAKAWTRTGWPLFQAGLGTTVHPVSRTGPGPGTSLLLPLQPKRDPATGTVAYPAGRVMILGGSTLEGEPDPASPPPVPGEVYRDANGDELLNRQTPATNTAEIIDLDDPYPQQWRPTAPMAQRRVMPDSVLLPDGKVLVLLGANFGRSGGFMIHFGASWGATNPANEAEIYDPATESWETMCRMATTRLYHATAALLPDARVVVAGHDGFLNAPPFTTSEYRLEIFSPPYLFRGPRPTILQGPASLTYSQRFFVRTDDADIASAALLRYSSVTHQTNTDQRYVGLDFQAVGNGLWLTAPPNGGVAPPGFYMLFLVNTAGVPSVARPVRVG